MGAPSRSQDRLLITPRYPDPVFGVFLGGFVSLLFSPSEHALMFARSRLRVREVKTSLDDYPTAQCFPGVPVFSPRQRVSVLCL